LAVTYLVGLYLRLSREDGNSESHSIQTQREMLTNYVLTQGWHIVDEYADDGYSGTDFDRPEFKRLLFDVEVGRINLVIVKDLSRLGRNYIDLGKYMEEIFPRYGVRLIALNDGYDSNDERASDFAPLRNYFNEMYAKDTSRKIRSILNMKAQKGEPRNTVFPIFGYAYNDVFERVPDPETAPIVQLIYRKVIELGSCGLVAKYLMKEKIKAPRYYNAIKYNYNKSKVLAMPIERLHTWTSGMVRDIILREEYLGVYKTAQSSSLSFKVKKRYSNKNCYVFENRYQPLIDKVTWELANKIISSTKSSCIQLEENAFKGLIFCGNCGKVMRLERRKNKNKETLDYRYYCSRSDCEFSNSISKTVLEEIVLKELNELKYRILEKQDKFLSVAVQFDCKGRNLKTDSEKELVKLKDRCDELDRYISKLFEQNVQGLLPISTFNMMLTNYKKEKELLESEIQGLIECLQTENENGENLLKAKELLETFQEYDDETMLQSRVIQKLIRMIEIRATLINGSKHHREFDLCVHYYGCDDLIKGFTAYAE